ncbi:MAG: hypothetical protein ACHREM_13415 [Polyangiales bacterium]
MNVVLLRVGAGTIAFRYEGATTVSHLRASTTALVQARELLHGHETVDCDLIVEDGEVVDIEEALPATSRESLV